MQKSEFEDSGLGSFISEKSGGNGASPLAEGPTALPKQWKE